ncbi:hypothetical protein GC096_30725 [Paenibacillus sp. LMG 31461]|uniref:DUF4747 family protein n=1 Tax=Paenibacillus plantarum TaxID=2654975 RepID=A0ABX1XKL1_9BACL|nr:hypothetical protein [Paenibacillus plantarum]NOU68405.1 hypothetical protein [Paenibacillus plantarum]
MTTKFKSFNAYQIDLHYQMKKKNIEYDEFKWESIIFFDVLEKINSLNMQAKTKRYGDSWLMHLDHLEEDEHFIFGRMSSAEYGTTGELIHADNLTKRPNPKQTREGETELTYFLIRKSDGFLLLQSNMKLHRARFEEYIEELGKDSIAGHNLTYIQICTLVNDSFFESIRQLNTVNKIEIEVTAVDAQAFENEAVRALQRDADRTSATNVNLVFQAKHKREGLKKVVPLLIDYKDKQGVTKIVVRGKLAGAEKVIKMDDSQERFKKKVAVDTNNQPMLSSVELVLKEIASQRSPLRS